jgi:DNA ligase-1
MAKTLAEAILTAETHKKHAGKHEALSGLGDTELKLIVEALNPYRVFGIKKFDMPTSFASVDSPYDSFLTLLDQLHDRGLTGNGARSAVTSTLALYTQPTATVLARVLLKDLRCNADESTFKKLYPTIHIPSFDMMGAATMPQKHQKVQYPWQWPCIGEAKYDGRRLVAIVKENMPVEYLSRTGRPSDFCLGLFDDELQLMRAKVGADIVVDGEVLGKSFQSTSNALGSDAKGAAAKADLNFFAFDIMTLDDWVNRVEATRQLERTKALEAIINELSLKKIIKSKWKILNNLVEAHNFYEEVLKDGMNDDGTLNGLGEGLIIKHINGFYQWNMSGTRTWEWTKWKPTIDVDVTITGVYEGKAGSKNEGKLGGVNIAGFNENGDKIVGDCGGFKYSNPKWNIDLPAIAKKAGYKLKSVKADAKDPKAMSNDEFFRTYFWLHPEELIGLVGMVEAQELCLAEGSDIYSIRFPRLIMLRDDKVSQV